MSLDEIAEQYKLELRVGECVPGVWSRDTGRRFYAHFAYVEEMINGMLGGPTGRGATPDDAIRDYARALSGKRVAIRAYTDSRQNVTMPSEITVGELEQA
jgi:hypothetical protein